MINSSCVYIQLYTINKCLDQHREHLPENFENMFMSGILIGFIMLGPVESLSVSICLELTSNCTIAKSPILVFLFDFFNCL